MFCWLSACFWWLNTTQALLFLIIVCLFWPETKLLPKDDTNENIRVHNSFFISIILFHFLSLGGGNLNTPSHLRSFSEVNLTANIIWANIFISQSLLVYWFRLYVCVCWIDITNFSEAAPWRSVHSNISNQIYSSA